VVAKLLWNLEWLVCIVNFLWLLILLLGVGLKSMSTLYLLAGEFLKLA